MSTATETVETAARPQEMTGSFRWVELPGRDGSGVLRINGKDYAVVLGEWAGKPQVKVGDWTVTVAGEKWKCNCPDYIYRRQNTAKGCKHTASVRAAVHQLKCEGVSR